MSMSEQAPDPNNEVLDPAWVLALAERRTAEGGTAPLALTLLQQAHLARLAAGGRRMSETLREVDPAVVALIRRHRPIVMETATEGVWFECACPDPDAIFDGDKPSTAWAEHLARALLAATAPTPDEVGQVEGLSEALDRIGVVARTWERGAEPTLARPTRRDAAEIRDALNAAAAARGAIRDPERPL